MVVFPALLLAAILPFSQGAPTLKAYQTRVSALFSTPTDDELEAWARSRRSKALAKETIPLIRIDEVPKDELLEWSDIFFEGGDRVGAVRISQRFVDQATNDEERYRGSISLSLMATGNGEYARSASALDGLKPLAGKAGQSYRNAVSYLLQESKKALPSAVGTRLYTRALDTLSGPTPTDAQEASDLRSSRDRLLADYAEFVGATEGTEAGKALLRKGVEGRKDKALTLRSRLAQIELRGKPIPALKVKQSLGTFPGFEAWRGKVVLVVFTAHWCGPCIGEVPMLREMQERRRDLRVVSVSTFYGFYEEEKNLAPEAEIARNAEWMRKYGMNWPLAFTDAADHALYGVHGIPHIVIVDKKGIVRGFKTGFGGDLEELEKKVAALATE